MYYYGSFFIGVYRHVATSDVLDCHRHIPVPGYRYVQNMRGAHMTMWLYDILREQGPGAVDKNPNKIAPP